MKLDLASLTKDEIAQHQKQSPIAILPLGATEQHGPHLPVNVDTLLAEALAQKVAQKLNALVLPAIPFGYSWVWKDIPGTLTLKQKLLEELIKDIARSIHHTGMQMLICISGHEANQSSLKYAVRDLADEITMPVYYFFYPHLQEAMHKFCVSPTWHGIVHACEFETSLMLAVRPDLVQMDQAVAEYPENADAYFYGSTPMGSLSQSGIFGDATHATAEKGELLMEFFTEHIVNIVHRLQGAP